MYDAILKLFENKPATPRSQSAGDELIELPDSITTEASAPRRRVTFSRWLH